MKRSIFYFDADATCLKLFRDALDGNYEVCTATTLSAARRALYERDADIIVVGQNMPEQRGADFLRTAAATHPHSFRVLLTDDLGVGDAIREVSTGVIQILIPKPWTAGKIREVVELAELQSRLRMKGRNRDA